MKDNIILRTVVRILVPFIFMYGLYIQFHGEFSPGGGFQAGVICASAFIFYALVYGLPRTMRVVSVFWARVLASFGVLLYAGVGVFAMIKGGNFLNYSVLLPKPVHGQQLGIIVIELGIGITVFSVMLLIFYVFAERSS